MTALHELRIPPEPVERLVPVAVWLMEEAGIKHLKASSSMGRLLSQQSLDIGEEAESAAMAVAARWSPQVSQWLPPRLR